MTRKIILNKMTTVQEIFTVFRDALEFRKKKIFSSGRYEKQQ